MCSSLCPRVYVGVLEGLSVDQSPYTNTQPISSRKHELQNLAFKETEFGKGSVDYKSRNIKKSALLRSCATGQYNRQYIKSAFYHYLSVQSTSV